jgi:DNA-binding transcriptional ArsR family regulator
MARSRSLPSDLFDDPDFFELESDTQVILLGLVLLADDYGRGPAHPGLLARKCNKDQAIVERALAELEVAELVQRYRDGRHCYYFLRRWFEWESLSKPTRSRYPAPPPLPEAFDSAVSASPKQAGSFREKPKKAGNFPAEAEEEGRREGESESEQEAEEKEKQKAEGGPGLLLSFKRKAESLPDAPTDRTVVHPSTQPAEAPAHLTEQVASILRLPNSEALARLVAEYQASPYLSLLGEADAAREYLDDPARNRRAQVMSLTFFRRWLKREEEAVLSRREAQALPGPLGKASPGRPTLSAAPPTPGGTHAPAREQRAWPTTPENPYRALMEARAQEVQRIFATTPPEERGAALQRLIQSLAGGRGPLDAAPA